MGRFSRSRRGSSRNDRRSRSSRSLLSRIPIVRWFGPGLTLATLLAAAFYMLTGKIDLSILDQYRGETAPANLQPVNFKEIVAKNERTIRIATFNIEKFGKSKVNNQQVMNRLAEIIAKFDVVAIQEVLSPSSHPVEGLVDHLNHSLEGTSTSFFDSIVGPPIGENGYAESAAFIWDATRIQFVEGSAYMIQDGDTEESDLMHREPLVASFRTLAKGTQGEQPFRFTLINVHTDPDEVTGATNTNELNVLDDVYLRVRDYEYQAAGEDDVIMLGDFNRNSRGLAELGQIPRLVSLAGNLKTNTVNTKTNDHILIDHNRTQEFVAGTIGVVDYIKYFGINRNQAEEISDHLPLYAEFSVFEYTPSTPENATIAQGGELGNQTR